MNKKGQMFDFDFDEEMIIGVIGAFLCAGLVVFIMARVENVGAFWKILGAAIGGVAGYFLGAKVGAGG